MNLIHRGCLLLLFSVSFVPLDQNCAPRYITLSADAVSFVDMRTFDLIGFLLALIAVNSAIIIIDGDKLSYY